jgi:hypothetical protein
MPGFAEAVRAGSASIMVSYLTVYVSPERVLIPLFSAFRI